MSSDLNSYVKPTSFYTGWSYMAPYLTPPMAASLAIVPVYYGFNAKSHLQRGMNIPKLGCKVRLLEGIKAAPVIGGIVGTQMLTQAFVEWATADVLKKGSFTSMLFGAVFVGAISAPCLAAFNGRTVGMSFGQSVKELSSKPKQGMAIVARETSFLFSLRISNPLGTQMKAIFGDNSAVDYAAAGISGAVGSLIGHPFDTALTLSQANQDVVMKQLMRGAFTKAVTVGLFSICYKSISQVLMGVEKKGK